ncbi:MAG: phage Gp37/Gp68 family protein [Candidatus Auribacterota bacterium]
MATSKIEWTESTWNPVTGCTKISPGCQNCYAERMANRLQAMGQNNYKDGFLIRLHPQTFQLPLSWKKSQMIFVNSMSDLFHTEVPLEYISMIFEVMQKAHWHTFQILTKRAERLLELGKNLPWSFNIWMGVSVENADYKYRIDLLKQSPAFIKFISFEPLIAPVGEVDLSGIDWVIVGGESGPKSRELKPEWAIELRDQCLSQNVPFFFKQWGGFNKKKNGRILEGRTWEEVPEVCCAVL